MQTAVFPAFRLKGADVFCCQACHPPVFARLMVVCFVMPALEQLCVPVGSEGPVYRSRFAPAALLTAAFVVTEYALVVGTLTSQATESLALIQPRSWVSQLPAVAAQFSYVPAVLW